MSEEDARAFLAAGTEGHLATCDRDGQPYVIPLNYLFRGGKIYFHCNITGRKLDNLNANSRVCFEVSKTEKNIFSEERPCACATRYTSVLAFGAARLVENPAEKAVLLTSLVEHLAAGRPFQPVNEQQAATCAVVEIGVDRISGKKNVDPE